MEFHLQDVVGSPQRQDFRTDNDKQWHEHRAAAGPAALEYIPDQQVLHFSLSADFRNR